MSFGIYLVGYIILIAACDRNQSASPARCSGRGGILVFDRLGDRPWRGRQLDKGSTVLVAPRYPRLIGQTLRQAQVNGPRNNRGRYLSVTVRWLQPATLISAFILIARCTSSSRRELTTWNFSQKASSTFSMPDSVWLPGIARALRGLRCRPNR